MDGARWLGAGFCWPEAGRGGWGSLAGGWLLLAGSRSGRMGLAGWGLAAAGRRPIGLDGARWPGPAAAAGGLDGGRMGLAGGPLAASAGSPMGCQRGSLVGGWMLVGCGCMAQEWEAANERKSKRKVVNGSCVRKLRLIRYNKHHHCRRLELGLPIAFAGAD